MVPLLDIETEEQRELLTVVHSVGKAVVDIVTVVNDVGVGNKVLDTLGVVLTEKLGESVLTVLAETVSV